LFRRIFRPSCDLDGDPGGEQEVEQACRGLHRDVQRGGERGGGDERHGSQQIDHLGCMRIASPASHACAPAAAASNGVVPSRAKPAR